MRLSAASIQALAASESTVPLLLSPQTVSLLRALLGYLSKNAWLWGVSPEAGREIVNDSTREVLNSMPRALIRGEADDSRVILQIDGDAGATPDLEVQFSIDGVRRAQLWYSSALDKFLIGFFDENGDFVGAPLEISSAGIGFNGATPQGRAAINTSQPVDGQVAQIISALTAIGITDTVS